MNPEQPNQPSPQYTPNPTPAPAMPPVQPLSQFPSPAPAATPSQFPVDYLNQIAAPAAKKKLSPIVLFGGIGAFLLVAIGALMLIANLSSPADFTTQARTIQARLSTLETVTDQQQKRLQQNQLSSMNTTLKTSLLSMDSDLSSVLTARGLKTTDAALTAAKKTEQTYLTKLTSSLNDAYLTGTLDRSYATQMAYELTILKSKIQLLVSSSGSAAVKDFYNNNVATLDAAITAFSTFTSSK
jgi:hypothetical protein